MLAVYGEDVDLRSRFKRRDVSRTVGRFVPQRLKLSANSEGSQVSGYLRRKVKTSKWKRCWFVLKDRVLYTYRASEDSVAIDTLPVLGWTVDTLDQVGSLCVPVSLMTLSIFSEGSRVIRQFIFLSRVYPESPWQSHLAILCRQRELLRQMDLRPTRRRLLLNSHYFYLLLTHEIHPDKPYVLQMYSLSNIVSCSTFSALLIVFTFRELYLLVLTNK